MQDCEAADLLERFGGDPESLFLVTFEPPLIFRGSGVLGGQQLHNVKRSMEFPRCCK